MSKSKYEIANELLRQLFAISKKFSFFDAKIKDGTLLRTPDEALKQGSAVKLVGKDGVEIEVADGDYTTEDGSIVTVKSGVVDSINMPKAEAAAEMATTTNNVAEVKQADEKVACAEPTTEPDAVDAGPAESTELDPKMLLETIKNLVDRVAALEANISDTSMAVEKMSAAPASEPFNFDPMSDFKVGTIGYEVEMFKRAKREKEAKTKKDLLEFNSKRVKPDAQVFSAPKQNKNTELSKEDFSKLDLFGGAMLGSNIG